MSSRLRTKREPDSDYRERVYRIVRAIPSGRVMTYGQIAELLGDGYTPRTVGFVMHGSDDRTPWHRVLNAQGSCSTGRLVLPSDKQQRMLQAEGVEFSQAGRCDLQTYLWIPNERSNRKSAAKKTKSLTASKRLKKRNNNE